MNHSYSDIFRAYDIRGLSPEQLNPHVAYAVARGFSDFMPKGKIVVGRDMRKDSALIAEGFIAGLLRQGREVVDLGLITSDMMYFAVGKYSFAGGAMVTASHNPGKYDGIKLTGKNVVPIGINSGLLNIKKEVESNHFKKTIEHISNKNKLVKKDILSSWVNHAIKIAGNIKRPLRVGIDSGNGMAAIYLPLLANIKNLEIESIFTELDGSFPNHPANPLIAKNTEQLQKLVVKQKLDCGIAFDGDGDRAFFIDEKGQRISASLLATLLAQYIVEAHPDSTVLANVVVSNIFSDTVNSLGGKVIRTKVGHSYIKADMKKYNAVFAAEHSGHYYFAQNYNADSGLIAALMSLHILSSSQKSLAELISPYRKYYNSEELNFYTKDHKKTLEILKSHFKDAKFTHLDGVTGIYDNWWFSARSSNTEPYVRVNIEATNPNLLEEKIIEIKKLLHEKLD